MKKLIILFACFSFISSVCFANEKASLAIYPAYGSDTTCLNNYLACAIVLRPDPSAPPGVFKDAIITNNSTITALNIIVVEAPPIAGVLPAPFNAESKVVYIPTTDLPSVPACYTLPNKALLPNKSCSIRFASSSSSFQQVSGTLTIKGSNTSPIHVTLEVISAD